MSFELFVFIGGYWSPDDRYHGGESFRVASFTVEEFKLWKVLLILGKQLGYEDNMKKLSWFPPETPDTKVDIEDDETMKKVAQYGVGAGAVKMYVVREDDPYIGRRRGWNYSLDDDEAVWDVDENEANVAEDVESGGESSDGEAGNVTDDDDSENDGRRTSVDEASYKKFEIGQEYLSIDSFKRAINNYAVKKRRDIKYKKSDRTRVVAICSNGNCPWRIYASINSSSPRVVIRSLQEEHNCTWQGKVSLLTSSRISEIYMGEFRLNPNFSACQLQEKLLSRNINVPWTKCERTRLKCLREFDREQNEQFARLFDYVAELKRANSGSTVELTVKGTEFDKFYVCFGALKSGWKDACRKIIHLDGTFLKWRMNGMLLVACGRDPNDQMFPIAWGIVEVENKPNWLWFLEHLVSGLDLDSGNGLTLASDQQKGLIAAVKDILPFAEHRMCARHVYSNWKKRHAGADLEDLFWSAADCYYPLEFERKMKALKDYDPVAHADLKINVWCPWSRAFFSEFSKCDAVENNLGESFNAAIRIARTKPIVEMLEEIRRRVLVSNDKKRLEADKAKGIYTPRAVALLDQQIELAKDCRPLSCGLGKYEVSHFNDRFVVHLRNETSCSCRLYLISGIPCCHIASALRHERGAEQDPKTKISQWWTVDKLRACYSRALGPVNGMNLWRVTTDVRVTRPPFKSPGGRPPGKNRKREKGEKKAPSESGKLPRLGTTIHCGNCGEAGHNRTNCEKTPKPQPPKKPPGRPRTRPIPDAPGWNEGRTEGQLLLVDDWAPWNADEAGTSSQPAKQGAASKKPYTRARKNQTPQSSQPEVENAPSLSSALPKRKRGRPRKNETETRSYSQPEPVTRSNEPIYDTGPRHIPREGFGVFTSPDSGDDYIQLGKSVIDARDNTVLPSSLYKKRDAKRAKKSKGTFVENWLSQP